MKGISADSDRPDYKVTPAKIKKARTPQSIHTAIFALLFLFILTISLFFIQNKQIKVQAAVIKELESKIQKIEQKLEINLNQETKTNKAAKERAKDLPKKPEPDPS